MSEDAPRGFSPAVGAAIAEAAEPRDERSVVVFDFDNTCILGDIGELFGAWLIDEMAYRYDLEEFWALIDPEDGRDEIRELVSAVDALDAHDPARAELYERYRAEMGAVYPRKLAREGKRTVYEWAVKLHVGLSESEIREMSRACCRAEWERPLTRETLHTSRGETVVIPRGVRRFRAIREVMDWARERGHEVWVVSATNHWTVREAALMMFAIGEDRVCGNRVETRGSRLTAMNSSISGR